MRSGSTHATRMHLSLIVPAFNRPGLLREALASACAQDPPVFEIIVVDDGSSPAVDESQLRRAFDDRIRVLRNDRTLGIDRVREIGARAARGDLVWQLDDDDLLAPGAVGACVEAFEQDPELEVLFVDVEGFGSQRVRHAAAQADALDRLLQRLAVETRGADPVALDGQLLSALLYSVPQAFQHPVVRRGSLLRVWDLRARLHGAGSLGKDDRDDDPFHGNLNEAEWAILASALCRCAFLPAPLYRVRCEGQGLFSIDAGAHRQARAHLALKRRLFAQGAGLPELAPWRPEFRRAYARALLELAHVQGHAATSEALPLLLRAMIVDPGWAPVAALLKLPLRAMRSS